MKLVEEKELAGEKGWRRTRSRHYSGGRIFEPLVGFLMDGQAGWLWRTLTIILVYRLPFTV